MAKQRKRRASVQSGEAYQPNEMTVLARHVRKAIKYIGAALFAVFAYLQLKDFQVGAAIETISPDLLRRLTMIAYYWCWVFGATFDTDIQEVAYYAEKGRSQLTMQSISMLLLFGIVMAALLWAAFDDRLFALALTAFFMFNIGGFAYVTWFVAPIIASSEARYRHGKNYFNLVQLEIVSKFMNGEWQWYRFALGAVLVVLMDVMCFSDMARTAVAQSVGTLLKVDPVSLAVRLPTFMFLLFVALLEGWIWVQRGRVMVSLALLDELSRGYKLEPKPAEN